MSKDLPLPKNKETREAYMSRCTAIKIDPSDSKWSDPNRVVAGCEMNWSKARESAAMILGSGDEETLFMVKPIEQIKASKDIQINADADVANEVFATLLNAATIAHMLHLQTDSYSKHKALEKLYEGLPDLADDLIEAYQSKYGIVKYPAQSVATADEPLTYVKQLRSFLTENRYSVAKDSELQNITDEITQLLDSTIYRLTYLK
jgi:Family of unknown function (DUF5856)